VITVAMVVRHVDAGGGARVRYLFPLLPIVATVAALALVRLPGGRRGGPVLLAVVAGVAGSLAAAGDASWGWWEPVRAQGPVLEGIARGLGLIGVPYPDAFLGATLVAVTGAVVAVGVSTWRLGAQRSPPVQSSASDAGSA